MGGTVISSMTGYVNSQTGNKSNIFGAQSLNNRLGDPLIRGNPSQNTDGNFPENLPKTQTVHTEMSESDCPDSDAVHLYLSKHNYTTLPQCKMSNSKETL